MPAGRAGPERLLAWNRGHWQVENGNHFHARSRALRPPSMGEDAARFRAGHARANHATLNNIVLAIVFHRASATCPRPTGTT